MAQNGMLGDYRFTDASEDIRGSKLYGMSDEKLGKIDDVIFDHASGSIQYVVVDTGGWLSSKKFVVPANRLRISAEHTDDFAVDLTKEKIEGFPPYDDTHLESDEQWADYEGRYRSKWESGPVMHRAETDHNITPTPQQMAGTRNSTRAKDAAFEQEASEQEAFEQDKKDAFTAGGYAAKTDSVAISQGANGIGPRWDTFQNRLRERRKEVVSPEVTEHERQNYPKAS